MKTLVISVADGTLRQMEQQAQGTGKSTAQIAAEVIEEVFGRDVNGDALYSEKSEPEIVRERLREAGLLSRPVATPTSIGVAADQTDARAILAAAGMIVPLSERLKELIIADVTLDEVQEILAEAGGPSLTEILDEHRGPKE